MRVLILDDREIAACLRQRRHVLQHGTSPADARPV